MLLGAPKKTASSSTLSSSNLTSQDGCDANILIMFLYAESMTQILDILLQFCGNSFIVMVNMFFLLGHDPFQMKEMRRLASHFEPNKKCVQVMKFSFKIKWNH